MERFSARFKHQYYYFVIAAVRAYLAQLAAAVRVDGVECELYDPEAALRQRACRDATSRQLGSRGQSAKCRIHILANELCRGA